ncbi:TetR/AcrR family transcriptional regulator [Prauserella muralis]|uniref:Transcriptional regulator n=1 Tax=Prauserella muralis TaxID=588067 RepID=A0A2V4ALT7_9PSEU|nr:TetR/AcrR family transcriptional regulator [Prauserella muralis]PXY21207.1 transcriptional regulator [Prauserella muralis]TWE30313.1 TetR family transcriptional regulator [Prauserella muralis]
MPPAFSAQERARITDLLLETGYRLFTEQGLRKTSLDELVAPAGMAKSSFYQFFDSKEALYLELMLQEAGSVKQRVIDEALHSTPDTREALRRFLRATLDELDTNPLWRRLTTHPDEMQAVARKLDADRVAAMADNPATALAAYIEDGQRDGELVGADPAVVVGVLQTVLLVPLHAERLGDPARYPQIIDLLIDIVTAGLTRQKG